MILEQRSKPTMTGCPKFPAAIVLSAALLVAAGPQPVTAQNVQLVTVDVQEVAKGLSASDLTGKRVVNDKDEKIGSIDDFVIDRDGHKVFAVLEVGGFLGVGGKKVAVAFDSLKPGKDEDQMVLPGASKDALEQLAEFKEG
jgi:sporulation protein YlmC with PRC-barrel domain